MSEQERFDQKLSELLVEDGTNPTILSIPGIYEILSEHYNNEIVRRLAPSDIKPCSDCGRTVIYLEAEAGWFHVDGSKCFMDEGATTEQLRVQLAAHPLLGVIEDDVWETLHPAGLLPPNYSEPVA